MSIEFLPTSRGTLIKLRNKLELVKRGKEILEMRREQLIKEILSLLEIVKRRPLLEHKLTGKIREISKIRLIRGENEFKSIVGLVKQPVLEVLPISFQGVVVPQIKIIEDIDLNNLKDPEIKKLARELWSIIKELIKIVNAEVAIEEIAEYLAYINRVVNSLEKVIIPEIENLIKYVEEKLEEESIEEFTRLKKISEWRAV